MLINAAATATAISPIPVALIMAVPVIASAAPEAPAVSMDSRGRSGFLRNISLRLSSISGNSFFILCACSSLAILDFMPIGFCLGARVLTLLESSCTVSLIYEYPFVVSPGAAPLSALEIVLAGVCVYCLCPMASCSAHSLIFLCRFCWSQLPICCSTRSNLLSSCVYT